jgi:uncharacterized membrane protein YwaF
VWLNVWFLSVEQYRLRWSAPLRLLAVLVPFVLVVRLIDWKFNENYMFLQGPTDIASPLDFLGHGAAYFIELIALAVVIFGIMFVVAPKEPRIPRIVETALVG